MLSAKRNNWPVPTMVSSHSSPPVSSFVVLHLPHPPHFFSSFPQDSDDSCHSSLAHAALSQTSLLLPSSTFLNAPSPKTLRPSPPPTSSLLRQLLRAVAASLLLFEEIPDSRGNGVGPQRTGGRGGWVVGNGDKRETVTGPLEDEEILRCIALAPPGVFRVV